MLLWKGSDKRLDKHSERLDDHEHRLTRVETQSTINAEEISKVREMRHGIIDEVSHKLSGWYLELTKLITRSGRDGQ